MKRHYSLERGLACGRDGKAVTTSVSDVTCLNCQNSPEYIEAKAALDVARKAAHEAQVPRQVREPWHSDGTLIVCSKCQGDLFRDAGRTCYGHYENFECANCRHQESRLTETGMSF